MDSLFSIVLREGFGPPTQGSSGLCSTRLSYRSILCGRVLTRTGDLLGVNETLYQLSYAPGIWCGREDLNLQGLAATTPSK